MDKMDTNGKENEDNKALRELANDADFRMYLDAVIAASQRSRAMIYVLLIALVAIYASYRNNVNPDWIAARASELRAAYADRHSGKPPSTDVKVVLANAYADGKLARPTNDLRKLLADYDSPTPTPSNIATTASTAPATLPPPASNIGTTTANVTFPYSELDALRVRIESLTRLRSEATTLQMPIIGLKFDTNDEGIIEGLILSLVLYVLASCLQREAINLRIAMNRACNEVPSNLELLLMAQVLSPAPKRESGDKLKRIRLSNVALYLFMALPAILHFFICLNNYETWGIRTVLESQPWRTIDTFAEWGFLALIIALSYTCCMKYSRLSGVFLLLESQELKHNRKKQQKPSPAPDPSNYIG